MNGPGYATTADTATGIRLMMRDSVHTVLRLDIVDKQSLVEGSIKKLYEGKVVSRGFSDQLVKVLPRW